MEQSCKTIPLPKSLKELLEFFSWLHTEKSVVESLQNIFNVNQKIQTALEAGNQDENNGGGSADELKEVLQNLAEFYRTLVKNSNDYGNYKGGQHSGCDYQMFDLVSKYLPELFWLLQYLYRHVNGATAGKFGFEDWQEQKTTDASKGLGKWLTDKNMAANGAQNIEPLGASDEGSDGNEEPGDETVDEDEDEDEDVDVDEAEDDSIFYLPLSKVTLMKRGFKDGDLKDVTGSALYTKLMFMDPHFLKLMKGLYIHDPWPPGRVGDMIAFLKGICTKMDNDDFRNKFVDDNGLDSTELKEKSQKVLEDIKWFTKKVSDETVGLIPINEDIFQGLSKTHVKQYRGFLDTTITDFVGMLAEMKSAMEQWEDGVQDQDAEEVNEAEANTISGRDSVPTKSMFYYGFQGDKWRDCKDEIKSAIDSLTNNEGGSLQPLLQAISGSGHTYGYNSGARRTRTGGQSAYGTTVNDSATARNVVSGLVGAGAAVGVGGAAYAGNVFGFGDLIRDALSSGAPAANLRG